jgi:alkylation response protein AidB-like acyl-CoA dehydrogenase
MDVLLSEDEAFLKDSAREFFEQECKPDLVRAMEADDLGYAADLWRKVADLGWLHYALPEAYGGDGAPLMHLGLLLEEAGRAAAPLPLLSTMVAALTLAASGSEAQCQEILPRVGQGDLILTWALLERDPRGTADSIYTEATRDGDHYIVNGSKLFVDHFNVADKCLVVARTSPASINGAGLSMFIVDTASEGVAHTLLPTMAGDKQSEVILNRVRVPIANVVGAIDQGWPMAQRMIELATALTCTQIVGASRKAVDMAVDYAKERVAFGRPIGAFQAIQHMCADIITWVDGAQLLTYEALWKLSCGAPASLEISTAKAFCNERCQTALRHANQIHAGVAQIKEFDLNLWFRRVAAWSMKLGTTFEHRAKMAQALELTSASRGTVPHPTISETN